MENEGEIDRTPGYVNKLANAMDRLAEQIEHQGKGLGQTIHKASQLNAETAERIAIASEKHAKSLSRATWALVGATIVLVIVTTVHAYIAASGH